MTGTATLEKRKTAKDVLRCRDIVLNLLSFARKQDLGEFSSIDIGIVIARSVNPALKQGGLVGLSRAQLTAGVGSSHQSGRLASEPPLASQVGIIDPLPRPESRDC